MVKLLEISHSVCKRNNNLNGDDSKITAVLAI